MKQLLFVITVLVLSTCKPLPVPAGDYYRWTDERGQVHFSNVAPARGRAYTARQMEDAPWTEVRSAEERDRWFWIGLKVEEMGEKLDKLTTAIREADRHAEQPQFNFIQTSTSVVTVKPGVFTRRAR